MKYENENEKLGWAGRIKVIYTLLHIHMYEARTEEKMETDFPYHLPPQAL
jgi:hypothetical protein